MSDLTPQCFVLLYLFHLLQFNNKVYECACNSLGMITKYCIAVITDDI